MFALIVACGGGGDDRLAVGDGASVTVATVTRTAGEAPETAGTPGTAASQEPEAEGATPEPSDGATAGTQDRPGNGSAALSGFVYPIAGACLPQGDLLIPNAPREYRNGTHEGIDFYGSDNCTSIGLGTPVVAAQAGRVSRIDHGYVSPPPAEMDALLANPNSEASLDKFRGRQVWIDHGDGIVTRYAHLSAVAGELGINDLVAQGTTIGFVGESGTPESVYRGGTEFHLHWELRVGGSYLGAGQAPAQVRALYLTLFSP